jgi:hypothetical protein
MKGLAASVRLVAVFGLALLAGVGVVTVYRGGAPRTDGGPEAASGVPMAVRATARRATEEARAMPREPAAAAPVRAFTAGDTRGAAPRDRPPARERRERRDTHALVRDVLDGKLDDRELTPDDYDRLTDVVLRVRNAARILRSADASPVGDAARVEQRQVLVAALAEVEAITGVPPSELGNLLVTGRQGAVPAPAP